MAKHAAVECRTHLRMRRWCEFLMERADDSVCHVRFSHTFVGADAHIGPSSIPEMSRIEIDAVCPQMCVVHSSEPKSIGKVAALRPNRAFRPRSGQKLARVSAQYNASPSASFLPVLFGQGRKERAAGGTVAVLPPSTALSVPAGNLGPTESSAPTECGAESLPEHSRGGVLQSFLYFWAAK